MDFSLNEAQQSVVELAEQILTDLASAERLKQLEARGEHFDALLWEKLAEANLLGLAVPEEFGGAGMGLFEVCLLLEQQGRFVAPVPLLATLLCAGLPIDAFGTAAQKKALLNGIASEGHVLSAALYEPGLTDPVNTRVRARPDGSSWRLEGEKSCVPGADRAARVLLPARTGEGRIGVFLLDPTRAGVELEPQKSTNGEPLFRMKLSGAAIPSDDVLGDPHEGAAIVNWLQDRVLTGLCAIQLGVTSAALHQTAEYTRERRQFGRPIGAFQGVSLRVADAFIDVEAIRSTLWQAAWRLAEGWPITTEVALAKWWACRAGHRVIHSALHLHGGTGSDIDYPLHRYFLWERQLELSLGGASAQLARIGAVLAATESPDAAHA